MTSFETISGVRAFEANYDGFIIDIWGVLHDGVAPYPGAIECLKKLRDSGKLVTLLSNAPRRAAAASSAMNEMGITSDLYDAIVTSGEVTFTLLRDRTDPFFGRLGRKVFHLGPARDRNLLDGLDLEITSTIPDADFLLNTGPDDHRDPTSVQPFEPDLQSAACRALPMVCANPDLEVIRGGRRIICAGALAQRYCELGCNDIAWVGKPDPLIYRPILEAFALPLSRVMAIGDSLRTDIAGAKAIGVNSCWVLGGIHSDQDAPSAQAAARGLQPMAAIKAFKW